MQLVRRTLLVASLLLVATLSRAQQRETLGLTDFPVPNWPADGVMGQDLKDKYVFIDLAKNEYVLAYPDNLGSATFEKDGPGPVKRNRYELLRNVEPAVTTAVTATGGKYKYVYAVANAAGAKQTIDQWNIVIPEHPGDDVVRKPAGWFGLEQKGRTFKVKNPAWVKMGATIVWSFEKPEDVIPAGSSKTGFEIETDLRPGLTLAYFRKAESVEAVVAASGNVPKPVKDQLDTLLVVEYNSKTMMLVGPKFDKGADDKTIAADYVECIGAMSRTGGLDANSDFVKTVLNDLKTVQGGAAGKLTAQPRTPAETEIFNALKLSLKLN